MNQYYKVYCSTCNRNVKSKMSWKRYLKYISFDGRSKGYHYIPIDLTNGVPNKCPFGHPVKNEFTVIIEK